MKSLFLTLVILSAGPVAFGAPNCTKYCKAGVSKPCGNACIPEAKSCRTPWTTACVGERPKELKGGKSYDKPKLVSKDEYLKLISKGAK